jgi:hypothetical protein
MHMTSTDAAVAARAGELRGPMAGRAPSGQPIADAVAISSPSRMSVIDVSRPVVPWSWKDLFLAPVELLALAWSVPVLILLVLVPFGLLIAGSLWLVRVMFGS